MEDKLGTLVMPGDVVGSIAADKGEVWLGAGLMQNQSQVVATKAGVFMVQGSSRFWVESNQKRYVPVEGDMVVGVVTGRHREGFQVSLGSAHEARLSFEQFEGASRKNRPNFNVNDLVFCRVLMANKDMEAELSCVTPKGKAGPYGPLEGGYLLRCSLAMARSLQSKESTVLRCLGSSIPFEIATGVNGRVWINSEVEKRTILVANALRSAEYLSPKQTKAMVTRVLQQAG